MMTRSWALVTLLSLVLLLGGLFFKNGALLAITLPYLIIASLPFWRALQGGSWKLERKIEPEYLWGDQPCEVTLSLTYVGMALEDVVVSDAIPEGVDVEGRPFHHGMFRAGQKETLHYSVHGIRGRYKFPGVKVQVVDLLGMTHKEEFLPCAGTLMVLPTSEPLEKVEISPRRTRAFTGVIRSRESGPGVEFFGTRAYVPGDPLRHLNWKAGARWDLLITNLFEHERVADVGIILDARQVAEVRINGESLFEYSVGAALSLANYFLDEGNRVGLLIYGRFLEWTFPGYGKQQRAKILAALTRAELGDHAVFQEFGRLPTRLFPRQSQIVLVSPLLPQDVHPLGYLRALGYRLMIVSPDPIAFEKRFLPQDEYTTLAEGIARLERNVTLAKLLRAGAQVVEWDITVPLRVSMKQLPTGVRR
jgi:uncharacterized protein (DUF58 family)